MCPGMYMMAPGVALASSSPALKQALICSPETRGKEIRSWESDHWTSPEQSKLDGPASPQMNGHPVLLSAIWRKSAPEGDAAAGVAPARLRAPKTPIAGAPMTRVERILLRDICDCTILINTSLSVK